MASPGRTLRGTLDWARLRAEHGDVHASLLVSADEALCSWVDALLPARGWRVVRTSSVDDARVAVRGGICPLVIVDAALTGDDTGGFLAALTSAAASPLPRVVVVEDGRGSLQLSSSAPLEHIPRPGPAGAADTRLAEALLTRAAAEVEAALARREVEALREDRPARPDPGAPAAATGIFPESERLYGSLFDRNPQPMWVYDLETLRFLAVNQAAVEAYGYTADEFLELTIRDIRPVEELPRLLRNLRETPPDSMSRSGVWQHRTRDGRVFAAEILSHEIVFRDRRARLVMARDVTEREQIEAALLESEQRYRALFDQSPLGVLQFDRELRVLRCNARLAEELGLADPDDLTGFDLSLLHDPLVLAAFQQVLRGQRTSYEGPYESRLAKRRAWIALRLSPQFDARGEVQGGIAIIEEVTARKEAEARLAEQAREMEELNARLQERTRQLEAALASRSRLYAAMNHELRTPLSAVVLYSDLLLGGTMGPLTPEQAEGVQQVQRSARHLDELVQDVLDLARLEAGKLTIRIEDVSLLEVANDVIDTVRPMATRRGCDIRLEADPAAAVVTDVRRVRQIVLNLLSNAVKFGAGQPVVVRCTALPDGGAMVSVSDQGPGIAPEDQERVFDDFVQVGGHSEGGSGLGLGISRRLAELLGGTLVLRSTPLQGTTFSLALPAAAISPRDSSIRYALDASA